MRKLCFAAALAAPFMLSGCNDPGGIAQQLQPIIQKAATDVQTFEQKAAPVVANACQTFRKDEANPLVQLAVAGGTMALNVETGGAAGPIVASLKGFGDTLCADGPPAGDATTPEQQAAWLNGQVASQMVGIAEAAAPAK